MGVLCGLFLTGGAEECAAGKCEFRVHGSEFRVSSFEFRVPSSEFRGPGSQSIEFWEEFLVNTVNQRTRNHELETINLKL